jgi:phage-related protein
VAETTHKVNIILNAQEKAKSAIGSVLDGLKGLATAAAGLAVGAAAGVGALAAGMADLALKAVPVAAVRETFDKLTKSIGDSADVMLTKLRKATNGMVTDADLMKTANQYISMGLAKSSDEAAKLAEMAARLGSAMGNDATQSMADFAAMLANQSIPRLDTFGISSGKVTARIEELMKANQGMTRESAFMQAVMEQGTASMDRLGAASTGPATTLAQLKTTFENLKITLGTAFLPALQSVLELLGNLATQYGPMLTDLLTNQILPPIMNLVQSILPTLAPLIVSVLNAVLPLVTELGARFVPVIVKLAQELMPVLLPLFEALVGVVIAVLDAVLPLAATLLEKLLPPFVQIISAILPVLMPLLEALAQVFVQVIEALMPLVEVLIQELLPIFVELLQALLPPLTDLIIVLAQVFTQLLEAIMPVVVQLVQELAPILRAVAEVVSAVLSKALEALTGLIKNVVGPAIEWLRDSVLEPVRRALGGISDAISGVIDWLRQMADRLNNLSLPDWLTPGSPTPFEMGLRGIADAMNNLPTEALRMGINGVAGGLGGDVPALSGAGAFNIVVNIGSVTEGNAYSTGQQAGRGIVDELRRQGVIV